MRTFESTRLISPVRRSFVAPGSRSGDREIGDLGAHRCAFTIRQVGGLRRSFLAHLYAIYKIWEKHNGHIEEREEGRQGNSVIAVR